MIGRMATGNPFIDATAADLLAGAAARWPAARGDRGRRPPRHLRVVLARGAAVRPRADRARRGPRRHRRDLAAQPARCGSSPSTAARPPGVVVVALNPRYRAHELGYILAPVECHRPPGHRSPRPRRLLRDAARGASPSWRAAVPGELAPARLPAAPPRHRGRRGSLPRMPRPGRRARDADDDDRMAARTAGSTGAGRLFTLALHVGHHVVPQGRDHHATATACRTAGTAASSCALTPDGPRAPRAAGAGTWGGLNIPLSTWSHGACLVLMDDVGSGARART